MRISSVFENPVVPITRPAPLSAMILTFFIVAFEFEKSTKTSGFKF
jgi:hypothetical protein